MADEGRVTVTVKGDGGAPWIVYRGNTNAEVLALMNDQDGANVGRLAAQISGELHSFVNLERGGVATKDARIEQAVTSPTPPQFAQQSQQGFAAAATTPPPAFAQQAAPAAGPVAPVCQHGPMTYREGTSARGPWKAYFCPTPKGTPGQCPAQFQR